MVIYCNSMIWPFQYFLFLLAVASLSPEVSGTLGVEKEVNEPMKACNTEKGKTRSTLLIQGLGNTWKFKGGICDIPHARNRTDVLSALERKGCLQGWLEPCPWTSTRRAGLSEGSLCLPVPATSPQHGGVYGASTVQCPWEGMSLFLEEMSFESWGVSWWESRSVKGQDGKCKYNPNCFSLYCPLPRNTASPR